MSYWVDALNNAENVFTKVWIVKAQDANTIMGPYNTDAEAKQAATGLVGSQGLTGWRGDLAILGGSLGAAGGIISGTSPSGLASDIGKGESALSGPNWQTIALRIGEGLLGIVLIGVGVAKISGASNVIEEGAKSAAKAAVIA